MPFRKMGPLIHSAFFTVRTYPSFRVRSLHARTPPAWEEALPGFHFTPTP